MKKMNVDEGDEHERDEEKSVNEDEENNVNKKCVCG